MRKKTSLQRGQIALYLLLVIIILGAFTLVSGGPLFSLSNDGNQQAGDIIQKTGDKNRESLQLETLNFQTCKDGPVVDFLVDTSASMNAGGKMNHVKDALKNFSDNFSNSSVTGIRRFSSKTVTAEATSRLLEIDFYKNNKNNFKNVVDKLEPMASTNTRTAFTAEFEDLKKAIADPRFKDKTFNVVFLSDGIPEEYTGHIDIDPPNDEKCDTFSSPRYSQCTFYGPAEAKYCRCFTTTQDPTSEPDLANQIKTLKNKNGRNVRIYSILAFDTNDKPFEERLTNMMKSIASPDSFYKTNNPEGIAGIYKQIAEKICKSNANNR